MEGKERKKKGKKQGLNGSGGLSQDFTRSGQNRVTAKTKFKPGLSHSAACNITAKFN